MPRRKPPCPAWYAHTHHLGALLVHRGGIEIVDGHIAVRAHRMGHRPGIFGELGGAQSAHVGEPLHGRAALVHRELLVAEHGQPFLQAQLEPVAAGDAVAGPVVEVIVGDHRLDALIVAVGRGIRAGQHVFGVEDVEPLVLHRPHVEIGDGGDVEHVEVVFQAEHLLVPCHRLLEAVHRVAAGILVAVAHPDREIHRAAGPGREAVAHRHQIARHQREQVAGLRVRVVPARPMTAVLATAAADGVAVGEQHGQA